MADNGSSDQGGVSGVSGTGGMSTADRADAARAAMDAGRTQAEKTAEGMVSAAVSTLGNVCSIDTKALAVEAQKQPIEQQTPTIDAINNLLGPIDQARFAQDLMSRFSESPDVSGRAYEGGTVTGTASIGPFSGSAGVQIDGNGLSLTGGFSFDMAMRNSTASIGLTDASRSLSVPIGGPFSGTYSHTPGPDGAVDRLGVAVDLGQRGAVSVGAAADIDVGDTGPKAGVYGPWQDRDETGKIVAGGVNVDNRKTTEFGQGVTGYYYDDKGRPTPYTTGTVSMDWNNIMSSVNGTRGQ